LEEKNTLSIDHLNGEKTILLNEKFLFLGPAARAVLGKP
jgi:hypothetical protein